MSTLKVAAINNPSASSGGLAISASGNVTGAGLDLITTQSFSAASSVSVNNCFSGDYDNYVIKISSTASGNADIFMRLRVSGTDSTSSYYYQSVSGSGGTAAAARSSNVNQILVTYCPTALGGWSSIDVMNPFKTSPTMFLSAIGWNRTTPDSLAQAGAHEISTAYDGFTMYSSANLTGTVSVYGYRK